MAGPCQSGLGPVPRTESSGDLSGIFSVVLNRNQNAHQVRWPSFSVSTRSFWTKYCLLCTVCGSAATILAGIFLVVAALFRYYTTSINYFETVPTYIPAILLSICGVSTIAFSCKRNRNIILLRITACWSLVSAALSSVITITTSLIHMNRLQTIKECFYNKPQPAMAPGCTCFSHVGLDGAESVPLIFENTPDCDVIHGTLYSCLRAVFAISVVAVLLSIFLCMLLYQLIGHERKKAYWSRIRRINSDWSADFIACLARPMPRERSSMLPLMMSPSASMPMPQSSIIPPPPGWGPPPPYEAIEGESEGLFSSLSHPRPPPLSRTLPLPPGHGLRIPLAGSTGLTFGSEGLLSPHPFSPTITSLDPMTAFRQNIPNSSTSTLPEAEVLRTESSPALQNVPCDTHSLVGNTIIDSSSSNESLSTSHDPGHVMLQNQRIHESATIVSPENTAGVQVQDSEPKILNNASFTSFPGYSSFRRGSSSFLDSNSQTTKLRNNSSLPCSPLVTMRKYLRQKSAENMQVLKSNKPFTFNNKAQRQYHDDALESVPGSTQVCRNAKFLEGRFQVEEI